MIMIINIIIFIIISIIIMHKQMRAITHMSWAINFLTVRWLSRTNPENG